MRAGREDALVRGLLTGIAAYRWLAWSWMAIVLLLSRDDLQDPDARPWLAVTLVGAALVVTAVTSVLSRTEPERLLDPRIICTELAVGFALGAGDGWVFPGPHAQSLGSVWPIAGILTAGVAWAGRGGAIAGAVVGLGRIVGQALLHPSRDPLTHLTIQAISTVVTYAFAGAAAGFAAMKLREAEREVSTAQAREEVARTLHDGVLQTLAVVQRRAMDPDLARLAREQERELREYLFGDEPVGGEIGPRLRAAAALYEDRFGGRGQVVLADDLPTLAAPVVDALVGAVGEALTNAGKHGHALAVTIYVEPDGDGVFCSVKDDGQGFDGDAEGVGITRSIRGRMDEVGGRVEIDGNPGRGTEVRLWASVGSGRG